MDKSMPSPFAIRKQIAVPMKNKTKTSLILPAILLCFVPGLYAQFRMFETPNLRLIYYSQTHEFLVPHIARCFENSLKFHRQLFDYTPTERVTIFLQDLRDYGYGGAETVPKNVLVIGMAPFSYDYETMPANERMNWMMNHELVHIVTMDKASPADHFYQTIFFGKVAPNATHPISMLYSYLTNPRRYSPRWFLEGSAVFLETWMAGGLGRALGGYDEMVFRTMVRDSSHIYDIVGLESEGTAIDFQVGVNAYLYGTRFMSYLADQYGPQKLIAWIARANGTKAYYAAQFKKNYGTSLDDEWSRWIQYEHGWQQANLDSLRRSPITPYRPISQRALGSISRTFFDAANRKLYAAIRYPGQLPHLVAIDVNDGSIKKIGEVKGSALYYVTSLAYDPAAGVLYYTTDNNGWRDVNMVDIKTGKAKTLLKDARIGDLAFNRADRSLWGVRHYLGISTLVRMPPPYQEWNQIYSLPYGKDIFDLDISPDGAMLAAAQVEISGRQKLVKMDIAKLLSGDTSHEVLFDFENSAPANFVFSSDGKHLYGSSYYSGVSNIYRYDFDTQEMHALSNCETGFFRPVPISDDSLLVMRYTGKGFVPVMIPNRSPEQVSAINFLGNAVVEKHPIVRSWQVGSPALVKLDSTNTSTRQYSLLRDIQLASAYPIVEGYKDFAAVGMAINFANPLGLSGFSLAASYSPNENLPASERVHLGFDFYQWQWKISAKYNDADFYDLFGPTKRSRKGYSLALQYKKNLIFDEPKALDYTIKIAGYGGLEKLPDFQNVAASFDKFLTLNTGLQYHNLRKSLGAVDDEKGVQWQLMAQSNYVNEKLFPRVYAALDYGIPLPINHSAIWARTSFGHSFGDRDEPFANFYFGGFGNNWIDYLPEKRYRDYDSFPGIELNAAGGTNYGKALLEWTLPPLRFRRLGLPTFYCNWARLALFSSGLVTNLDSKASRRKLANFGGQLDFRLVMLSHLNTTLSFGYGVAAEKGQRPAKEFMVSLKIL